MSVSQSNDGSISFFPEPCPLPRDFVLDGCQDAAVVAANDTVVSGLGRIIQVDVLLKQVCPGRRVAAAILLSELDEQGTEHARGSKTLLIPAQSGDQCRDILLRCVNFVVPEALSPTGSGDSLCSARRFQTRVLANYVDTDYVCCDPQSVTP